MDLLLRAMAVVALVRPCICAGVCSWSTQDFGASNAGAFHFPVFHREHPCVAPSPPVAHAASVSDAGTVIADARIHKGKYLMAISLGTPAVFNLVAIDTGSTLSWVQCRRCQIHCHLQAPEAGRITYRRVGCGHGDCLDLHDDTGGPYGCVEETNTCLYLARYGSSQYSAGKVGTDRLSLGDNFTVADDFVFGCSEDDSFLGYEAGLLGFGNKSYSYLNQVARRTSYNAFAYCFPGDHRAEGFLTVGPYPRRGELELVTPLIMGYGPLTHAYSIQQLDMAVDGRRLDVEQSVYTRRMIIVDSGTEDTFISAPVFYAFEDALTAAMRDKGYAREYGKPGCFRSAGGRPVDWGRLPTVEMRFIRATLKLPPENAFHQQSEPDRICSAFKPDDTGVNGVQILGNMALRSFRVVFDLQKRTLGFQARAC